MSINKYKILEARINKLEGLINKRFKNERIMHGPYDVRHDDKLWDFKDDEYDNSSYNDGSDIKTAGPVSDKPVKKSGGSLAEKFENVICDALYFEGKMPDDYKYVDVIKKVCNTSNPEGVFGQIYNTLSKTALSDANLHALPGNQPVTQKWIKLGFYDVYDARPSGVPKTDIIGGRFHVSVKKKGGSQLMSGTVCETLATINAALLTSANDITDQLEDLQNQLDSSNVNKNKAEYIKLVSKYDELEDKRDELLDKISDTKNVMDNIISSGGSFKQRLDSDSGQARKDYYDYIARKNNIELSMKNINKQIDKLQQLEDDPEFAYGKMEIARKQFEKNIIQRIEGESSDLHDAILREAITGQVKFGYGAPGCANYVLVWDEDGTCEVFNIDEYLNHIRGHNKFDLSYKSNSVKLTDPNTGEKVKNGQYDSDIALRITVNN